MKGDENGKGAKSVHGEECLEGIIERKNREWEEEGKIFWGYGKRGSLHPTKQVQPFIEHRTKKPDDIEVLMSFTKHNPENIGYLGTEKCKEQFSKDEEEWKDVPPGICTELERALVLKKIRRCHFHLDLRKFEVGIGDSCGKKSAAEHLKGPSSRGCFVKAESRYPGRPVEACITYRAYLKSPHAVFLR